jgi:hypothetical protein
MWSAGSGGPLGLARRDAAAEVITTATPIQVNRSRKLSKVALAAAIGATASIRAWSRGAHFWRTPDHADAP